MRCRHGFVLPQSFFDSGLLYSQPLIIGESFWYASIKRKRALRRKDPSVKVMMTPAKILVVEDEFLVAIQIESILSRAGWRVIGSAGTLASAVSLARKSPCDAAVLDVNLKGERVDEVASILSERRIPFLFVSGYGRGKALFGHDVGACFFPAELSRRWL